ncbi:hypothetical protein BGZ63DRAFT_409546 [Mariannaea sp. PMI_226]|nr:hypothetical protein BGZ63DRAFT_409546 [Mariannaea sp. PMI_226]
MPYLCDAQRLHRIEAMNEDQHARVHSRCSICGFLFDLHDTIYARESTSSTCPVQRSAIIANVVCIVVHQNTVTIYGEIKFPSSGYCDNNHDHPFTLCRIPSCEECGSSAESSTAQTRCPYLLQILPLPEANKEKFLSWLCHIATWSSPWQGVPPLDLEPYVSYRLLDTIPRLLSLPPELRSKIWDFCASSHIWLLSAIEDLQKEMETAKHHVPCPSIPLVKIKSWARGSKVEYSTNVRHAIPSDGNSWWKRPNNIDAYTICRVSYHEACKSNFRAITHHEAATGVLRNLYTATGMSSQ